MKLDELNDFAAWLEKGYDDFQEGSIPDEGSLALLLGLIRDCRADLAAFYKRVEQDLMATAGKKRFEVMGLGEVEIKKSTKRTQWRHDELLAAVISRVMDEPLTIFDPESGELLPYTQIGANVTARLRECVSFGAGKVTGLRAIGLAPDEFCNEEEEGYSVKLPPRKDS